MGAMLRPEGAALEADGGALGGGVGNKAHPNPGDILPASRRLRGFEAVTVKVSVNVR